MHTPVFLNQVMESLGIKRGGQYIDATAGEGGHLKQMLLQGARVLAIDWNPEQITALKKQITDQNVLFHCGNFADIETIAGEKGFAQVDGILFDLGLSMRELQNLEKGFSYKRPEEPLDMRLNEETQLTAAEIINRFSEEELADILAKNSEELYSAKIAKQIVEERRIQKIYIVGQLLAVLDRTIGGSSGSNEKVYARIFQALRIAVNEEPENLQKALAGGMKLLAEGGKMVVITFHSLEDRAVKLFARRNHIVEKRIEVKSPHSFQQSAKLRVLQK